MQSFTFNFLVFVQIEVENNAKKTLGDVTLLVKITLLMCPQIDSCLGVRTKSLSRSRRQNCNHQIR